MRTAALLVLIWPLMALLATGCSKHSASKPASHVVASSEGRVALDKCPLSGLYLPATSKVVRIKDQQPEAWTVYFNSQLDWAELRRQIEEQLFQSGWKRDELSPEQGEVIRYNSPDGTRFAVLMNPFSKATKEGAAGASRDTREVVEKTRQANGDFVFAIFQTSSQAATSTK